MKFNKYLICALFLVLICCIGAASAAEADDAVAANDTIDEEVTEAVDVSDEIDEEPLGVSEEPALSDGETPSASEKVIYVGQNTTDDGGNGSYENPYANLDLACDNVNGEDTVNIYLFTGTYYVGSELKFNTGNLNINALNGEVIIKNEKNTRCKQAIELTSADSNFTMNNIIFDGSGWTLAYVDSTFFTPFYGTANYGTYNNCTFIGSKKSGLTGENQFNAKFLNCIFKDYSDNMLFKKDLNGNKFIYFENDTFLLNGLSRNIAKSIYTNKNITLKNMWFGQNDIPDYLKEVGAYNPSGSSAGSRDIPVVRYAIFSVSENYLGNNLYEIIGKLCWNGTNDTVGGAFAPMTVTLTSASGEIQSNVTLENGVFRAVYTSNSSDNLVTATLDYETIDLNFTNVEIQLDAPSIHYGDDQNITLTLPQAVNATVTVTVNNKTYELIINNTDSVTYTIEDILTEGNYTIEVILKDVENHLYGSNSTVLSVSKVSDYTFDALMPSDVKVGDTKVIIVELPDDATGNVLVQIGENNFTKEASQTTEIEVSGFKGGDNIITITYFGNDKYAQQTKVNTITAEKGDINADNVTVNVDVAKGTTTPSFNIALPIDATGNLTVTINGKNYTKELVNGSATVDIPALNPGKYNAVITYSGDKNYNPITTNTTFSISKPVLTAKNFQMLYTSGAKYTVCVTLDGKAVTGKTVIFTINGKKATATTDNNGYASVKINLPPKSKAYTLTTSYLGVKITNKVTVKSILVAKNMKVKKSAKKLKIKVTLKKVNKKYLKGKKVTLKFKGKTYKAKTSKKGVATFTIKKNVLKKLKAGKKYSYKVTYGKDVVNKKITVKK